MQMRSGSLFQTFRFSGFLVVFLFSMSVLAGCDSSGVFLDSPVAGLTYRTGAGNQTVAAKTGRDGTFNYQQGETITFSIGDLILGSAEGKSVITPLDIVPDAANDADQRVVNICVLLQTLDKDGDLNNGIQISSAIATQVSAAGSINFDQTANAFAADPAVTDLLAALNAASPAVFTDTDPRPRTLRSAAAAREHFIRSTSERKVVKTAGGAVKGYAPNKTTWQFLGIPYAKPPLGELRWRPPQSLTPWKGVRDAIAWSDQAAQDPRLQKYGEGGMSEDCLYLNVTAPKNARKLPVMVWFHGGGYTALTSNTKPFNNPESLATKGVVMVSVNHRLGVFGFLAHPELTAESGYNGSGNYGNMDLVAALKWVRHNIKAFGGDPGNVTIFGESGGGRKVLSMRSTPLAKGLFHKAICQSGSLRPDTRGLAEAEAMGTELAAKLGTATLAEMRAKSWPDVVAAAATAVPDPYPNVDNHYFPDTERSIIESGKQNDTPFMIVINSNDTVEPIGTIKNYLPWMADNSRSNVYACLFTKSPSGWAAQGIPAYHGSELTYVFNSPSGVINHFLLNLVLDPATGARLVVGDLNGNGVTGSAGDPADIFASAGFDAVDATMAQTTMTIWTNFAKTGKPGIPELTWPVYTSANDTYFELGASFEVKTGLSAVFP